MNEKGDENALLIEDQAGLAAAYDHPIPTRPSQKARGKLHHALLHPPMSRNLHTEYHANAVLPHHQKSIIKSLAEEGARKESPKDHTQPKPCRCVIGLREIFLMHDGCTAWLPCLW